MKLADLSLAPALAEHYRGRGVESLYPPQEAAVEAGVLSGESVVAAVPTASGKTLIGELAMATAEGTALYIVPLRALAAEKHREFEALPGASVGISTGDFDGTGEDLADDDVVVATSEKVDSLVRNGAPWLDDLSCVVIDEIHLLDSEDRGPTLEMTIAKLGRLNPDLQLIGLSATVGNARALADWLDASLVETDWRPIELRRGVYYDGQVAFHDAPVRRIDPKEGEDAAVGLVRDALHEGGQCLAFVHSRRAAERLAGDVAAAGFAPGCGAAGEIRETARTGTGRSLAERVGAGVAFHHAGLRAAHRTLVEEAFRERDLAVVCATPTLAAGVNLPARRVVVRDHRRYTGQGWEPLSTLEVHQMFGRAGRPGLDPYGEAVVVADGYDEARELHGRYVEADPGAVSSKLATQEALRTHVLATIASGFAADRRELLDVLSGTFYAFEEEAGTLIDIADLVLDYLESASMVESGEGLRATDLGEAVSRLYVDPTTGEALASALDDLDGWEEVPRVTVLEVVCDTPDVSPLYLRGPDRAAAYRFATANEDRLLKDLGAFEGGFEEWLGAIKTVQVLEAWIDGAPEDEVTEEYGIGPGDLRTKVERVEWLLGAFESIADLRGSPHAGVIGSVRSAVAGRDDGEGR